MFRGSRPYQRIFQSTLPRGERRNACVFAHFVNYFNPRSHEGSDALCRSTFRPRSRFQSTLPRGERLKCMGKYKNHLGFQSTLPRGERHSVWKEGTISPLFQSTLPRGERQQFSPRSSLFSQQKLSKIFNLNNKLF